MRHNASAIKSSFFIAIFLCGILIPGYGDTPKFRSLELDCQIDAEDIPAGASDLKIWLPQPPQNSHQAIETLSVTPNDILIAQDKIYKNKIIFCSFNKPKEPVTVRIKYKIRRYEYSKPSNGNFKEEKDLSNYLISNRLMIVSNEIKQMSANIVKGKATTIQKAKAIYDYVLSNVSYDKTIPGWGKGDTRRVCLLWAGNCTDFHSLFISLARASNIPAKFVIGVSLPKQHEGELKDYHCWAEFYDEESGWVPVDISEAWKDKTKRGYYFGNIDEDRIEFSQGRDIALEPKCMCEPLNYFFYPYAQVNGEPFENVKIKFHFRDL